MTREALKSWLRAYRAAWEQRDAQGAVDLFAEDAVYLLLPFTPPIRGRPELLKYWKHVASSQEQVHFDFEILAVSPAEGIAHWKAGFLRRSERKRLELDGICVLSLNSEGRCTRFQEWWHKREMILRPDSNETTRPAATLLLGRAGSTRKKSGTPKSEKASSGPDRK